MKMKVLICDDEIEIINVLKKFLESKGLLVDCALDGREAVELIIREKGYNIVFLDVNMPEFTGIEILRYIREHHVKAKVVVLTGYPEVDEKFLQILGADEYLEKPIDPEAIGKIVDKYAQYADTGGNDGDDSGK